MKWRAPIVLLATALVVLGIIGGIHFSARLRQPADRALPVPAAQDGLRPIMLDGQVLHVSVANTPQAREIGLGGRSGLAADEGMLFVFDSDGSYALWMKDMRFSIDILWLAADGTIVNIKEAVAPATYPATFSPKTPARYVLELPVGYVKAHAVKIGDRAGL